MQKQPFIFHDHKLDVDTNFLETLYHILTSPWYIPRLFETFRG